MLKIGDILNDNDGQPNVLFERENDTFQAMPLEPWMLTEGYQFHIEGVGMDNVTWEIVADEDSVGDYGCIALRV